MLALRSEGCGLDGAVATGAQELVSPFRQRNRAQDFTFCDALWFPALFGGRIKEMPRERIDTGSDKRYVRRDKEGRFKESEDVGRSSAQDQKRDSKTTPKRGEGDKGDR
ncbi:hypothetical protein [Sphingomonas hankyongi]|uniref:Uncharacterized protein n=1 Tax=Sphingomonas hankyongi TaxID=2908209 RepID=A0ABT0S1S0_9SPHN|nr:hypothetical protein [Sphingomonas hankyongi]MCL6729798.1 hypothetical protein [Sphingomonas hankyongi]